jgi:riboflavin biosynthesis pyrimidine reductase
VIVQANLVIGADGSTTINGRSKGLSSAVDRERFHKLRQSAQVILIGGNSARNEPYANTPTRLVVVSKDKNLGLKLGNPLAEFWDTTPLQALTRLESEGTESVLIEGGVNLLKPLLAAKAIDDFFITKTRKIDGENKVDLKILLLGYNLFFKEFAGDEEFCHFKPER